MPVMNMDITSSIVSTIDGATLQLMPKAAASRRHSPFQAAHERPLCQVRSGNMAQGQRTGHKRWLDLTGDRVESSNYRCTIECWQGGPK